MKKIFGICVLGFGLCTSAGAATYFVDFQSGSDSNSGTSSGSPWKHAPGDDSATGNVVSTLTGGDIVVFKGGVTYQGSAVESSIGTAVVRAKWSGRSGSPITYISGDVYSTPWGTGRADVYGGGTKMMGFVVANQSYITIDGFEIRNFGTASAPITNAAGVYFENPNTNNIVRRCKIHEVNYGASGNPQGYGIENNHGSYHTYEYNEIYRTAEKLIEIYGSPARGASDANHCVIRYNTLHNSGVHGVVLSGDDIQFYSNIVYQTLDGSRGTSRSPGYGLKVDEGSRNQIFNNIFHTVNTGLGVLGGDNNTFAYNVIYGLGTNGAGYPSGEDDAAIALQDDGTSPWPTPPFVVGNKFINNIIYYLTPGEPFSPWFIFFGHDGGNSNLIQNNLFYKASGDTKATANRVNYSNRSSTCKSGCEFYSINQFEASFNTWEGGSGNLASGNLVVDPGFRGGILGTLTNKPTDFINTIPRLDGFNVNNATAKAGLVLASPFNVDILGVTRPNSPPTTIGAYEYGGVVTNTLNVSKSGAGQGTVTSSPAGINCGIDCAETFTNPTNVTLTATPLAGFSFGGWSGACTGTGNCTVSVNGSISVTASFTAPPPDISGGASLPITVDSPLLFNVTSAGLYKVVGNVNIADGSSNSFYVNIDAPDPGKGNGSGDETKAWDLSYPATNQDQDVTWRGANSFTCFTSTCPEFNPKIFNLTVGVHTLYINDREPGAQIQSVRFVKMNTANQYHPADISPQDSKISLNESTAYGACWRSAPTIPTGCPNPAATLDNSVRAGSIWNASSSGSYHYDSSKQCPLCWVAP